MIIIRAARILHSASGFGRLVSPSWLMSTCQLPAQADRGSCRPLCSMRASLQRVLHEIGCLPLHSRHSFVTAAA